MICCGLPICSSSGKRKPKSRRGRMKREQAHIDANPFCVDCGRPATDVDHLGGRGLGGWRRDIAELASRCHACHMRRHGERIGTPINA